MEKMKICDHIYQVGGDGMSGPGDAAIYLAAFDNGAALIDAGCGQGHRRIIENISRCIGETDSIDYLFLTHCHFDHTGGAAALREQYGCKIVCHEQDARFLEQGDSEVTAASWYAASMEPLAVDVVITGTRQAFTIGTGTMEALHWPGHSPGSVVYVAEAEGKKVLFGQDVHGPLHPALLSNRDDYLTSLTMLTNLEADVLCEGHFGVIEGRDRIRAFIQQFMD